MQRNTYTDAVIQRRLILKVDSNTGATLGAKQLILGFGVELVHAAPRLGVIVPGHIFVQWIYHLKKYTPSASVNQNCCFHTLSTISTGGGAFCLQVRRYPALRHIEQLHCSTTYSSSGGDSFTEKVMLPQ